jgi:hypothetical protein
MRFSRFVGIDWSGARGVRHPSVQVAVCEADGRLSLVLPEAGVWSRAGVLEWLRGLEGDVLVGMDAGFGFPMIKGFEEPARGLWADVEAACADEPDLGGHGFVDARREAFWMGAADGPRHERAHLRVCERVYAERGLGAPTSNFVLLGASQVGKASLAAMRLLHRLEWPVWPFDPLPARGPVITEIYCQAYARMAGVRGKVRDRDALAGVLAHYGVAAPEGLGARFADHVGDALMTAAGLRATAGEARWWAPEAMTPEVAEREGWTFGIA